MSYAKYKDLAKKEPTEEQLAEANPGLVINVKSDDEIRHYVSTNAVTLIYIWAEWCGPCKRMGPLYINLAKKYSKPGVCMFLKEDVELGLKSSADVKGVPYIKIFKHGRLVDSVVGADIKEVEQKLLALLQL